MPERDPRRQPPGPAPMTHWARVAPASTRLPWPTTVGPMIVTPSPTSAPSCSTTGPTRVADGWTRTPGAACREEPRPSRVGARRARASTMRSFRARRPCSVPRFTAPPSRGRSRLGTPSEARTRRRRGRDASGQLERDTQAGHRDERARDAAGEGPRDGVVVALDAPDAARGIRVHVLLGALAAPLEGHEVLDAARVVRLVQSREGGVLGFEREAGGVRQQEPVRGLVGVEALDEAGERVHGLGVRADLPDRPLVLRVDLESRHDDGRGAGDGPEAGSQVTQDGSVAERGQEQGTPARPGKEPRAAVEEDGKGPHAACPDPAVLELMRRGRPEGGHDGVPERPSGLPRPLPVHRPAPVVDLERPRTPCCGARSPPRRPACSGPRRRPRRRRTRSRRRSARRRRHGPRSSRVRWLTGPTMVAPAWTDTRGPRSTGPSRRALRSTVALSCTTESPEARKPSAGSCSRESTLDRPLVQGEVGVGVDHARGDRAGHVRGHVLPCPVETRDQLLLDVLEAVLRDEIEGPAVEDVDAARPQPPRGVRAHDDGDRRAGGLVGVEQLLQVHHRHRGPVRDDEGVRVGLDPGVAHAAGGAARAPVLEVVDAHADRRAVEVRADGTRLAVGADRRATTGRRPSSSAARR